LRDGINYLVPIPAFFYFQATGLLDRRTKKIVYVAAFGFLCLFFVTIAVGPKPIFDLVNSIIVIVSLIALVALSLKKQSQIGTLSFCGAAFWFFVVFALVTNVANILWILPASGSLGLCIFTGNARLRRRPADSASGIRSLLRSRKNLM